MPSGPTAVDAPGFAGGTPAEQGPEGDSWWCAHRRDLLAVAVVLCATALPLRGLYHYQGPSMEEGFMLVFPERILAGDVPNRDFLHLYGPGSLWVLAAVYKLFGTTLEVERTVGLAQHLALVFGVFAIARAWGRRLAVVCSLVALVIIIGPIGLTALAWNGAVGLAVCGLAVAVRARRRLDAGALPRGLLTLAGVLAAASLLYRPDLVVAVSLGFGAALWRAPRPAVRHFAVAFAATASLVVVHLVLAGPRAAIEGMLVDPVFRLRGGRSLPVPPSGGHFDGWLQKAAGLVPSSWPLPAPTNPRQVQLWFLLLPLVALTVAGVGVWRMRAAPEQWRSRVLLAAGLFGVGLLPQAFQRPDTAHLAWVSCISFAFLPLALWEVLHARFEGLSAARRTTLASLPVVLLLLFAIPFQTVQLTADLVGQTFGRQVRGTAMTRGDRTFYFGSADAADAAQRLIDRLDAEAEPGQRLFVGPVDLRRTPYSDAFFYYLFPELEPATRYIEMDPGMANAPDSGLARDVAGADWLVLSDVWSGWDEPNDSRLDGPDDPNQVVRDHFCEVEDFRSADDSRSWFRLLERCR